MKIPVGFLYTKEHQWVKVEGNMAYIGITDYAQSVLEDIIYLELPEEGAELKKGESRLGVVESVKTSFDICCILDGVVEAVNEALTDDPGAMNDNPYDNWLVKMKISDTKQLEELLSGGEYKTYCDSIS